MAKSIPLDVRFWRLVDRSNEGGCWIWTGKSTRGYGFIRVGQSSSPAHRVAYRLLVGPIPDGHQLDHLCRNKGCVNPAHLEPVTAQENVRREREARGHCPKGHPYDAEHTSVWGGRRYCRVCRNDARLMGLRRRRTGDLAERTHCKNGHPMERTGRRRPNGRLVCVVCASGDSSAA